jgi:hypothetical protein
MLQGLLIWKLIDQLSKGSWAIAWLAVPATAGLVATAYDVVMRGTLTQKILWWIFLTLGSSLGVDIFKLLHHSLTRDPFLTIFNGSLWIGLCIIWIRRRPFETKTPEPIKSTVPILRD